MKEHKNILLRFYVVMLLLVVFAAGIVYKIIEIQNIDGEHYKSLAKQKVYKTSIIEPNRGNLYDANMNLLATSVPEYELRFDAVTVKEEDFNDSIVALSEALAKYFNKPTNYYLNKLKRARNENNRYLFLAKGVNYVQLKKIKSFPIFNLGKYRGGLIVEQSIKREQPLGKIGRRTIGYNSVGLDGAYDEYLKGKTGKQFKQKISKGQWRSLYNSESIEPEDGLDVVSTIDINIQDIAHHALLAQLEKFEADHGSVIVMETKTGDIKAVSNLGRTTDGNYFEKRNYAVYESHEPGSTFKLMSLAAALEDKVVDTSQTIDTKNGVVTYYNRKVMDSRRGGYGEISVGEGLVVSSNTVFAQIINDSYKTNPEKFVNRLYNMGLNEKIGLDIKGEGQPRIPHPDDKNWYGTTLPWMSFGYGVSMTPLQILTFYNAIANDGVKVKPRFIKKILNKGETIKAFEDPEILNSVCSKETARILQDLLRKTVERGTAENIYNKNYSMAGKTGTCQTEYWVESGRYIASFAGYFPAEDTKYSCIVTIHKPNKSLGYYGSTVAAPVFSEIAEKIYTKTTVKELIKFDSIRDLKTKISIDEKLASTEEAIDKMPDVKGLSLMDAMTVLENMGLKVEFSGEGVVKKQSVSEGQQLKAIKKVKLVLG
jgi:cell division protein FtsI (penicillin-binding protein 3)